MWYKYSVDINEIGSDVLGQFSPPSDNNVARRHCVSIAIMDDQLFEDTETFSLELTLNDSSVGVLISPNFTIVHIFDNDGELLHQKIFDYIIFIIYRL